MVTDVTILQKNRYKGTESSSMSGFDASFYQRAIDRGNSALLPLAWSDWSDFYRPQAVAGTEIIGSWCRTHFVLRIPANWNGMLVSAATPATRDAFSLDIYFADFCQAQGFAYLASDKSTPGMVDAADPFAAAKNALLDPAAMERWHQSYAWLTAWAQRYLKQKGHEQKGQAFDDLPAQTSAQESEVAQTIKTFAVGLSNGGYVVRRALECGSGAEHLFAGGLDVEGVCWLPEINLITTLRDFILEFTAYRSAITDSDKKNHRMRLLDLGLPDCPERLWQFYHEYYWYIVFNIYRDYFDRDFPHSLPWHQYLELESSGLRKKDRDLDLADYHWSDRLKRIKIPEPLMNTGELAAPLISVYGTWDCLTVPKHHLFAYVDRVKNKNKVHLHRCYAVEKGTHIDSLVHSAWDPGKELQPMMPEARRRFNELLVLTQTPT